ncbi:pyridoxamine 5'-phosphate oxidase family protein [Conexibacter sp. CPCC 206217]|uniref:pyridoxamine 5'-phosphate oxidase family protein n=1 Tax=Conexibacter sp. CPCC 206217 TaxID=3064574 RepID=UPI0027166BB7|nr:pyridoxamine 5'-phosphate oxidase family protein [Conexibacter sp. CPCC 206217]MDO8210349.1 pyridoxamine 5'-phosphate oxidase family protein [Conexibacter sp. CPCC 206217]
MPSWSDFTAAAPALAAQVQERLDAHVHKTLATLRRDGAPRISGTETRIAHGELWIGSMWQARKALDLLRDPRYALHSGSDDPPAWSGDAKLAGIAEELTDPALVEEMNGEAAAGGPSHLFRLDIREASVVSLREDGRAIVITSWKQGGSVRTLERD